MKQVTVLGLWLIGGAITLANLSGYIGSSDDEFRAARESRSMQRALVLERLGRLRAERVATLARTDVEDA